MESLLHSTDNDGQTMVHLAAIEGYADVLRLIIDNFKLNPTARCKVCVELSACSLMSSRLSDTYVCCAI